jgi:predicted phosphodiesterase
MKFNWPESFELSYEHYFMPKNLRNLLVLSDIHIPYHHIPALDEAVEYGIIKKIDAILLNGDIIDCYMLSKFQPDPRERNFGQEIIAFHEFIRTLKSAFPKAPIYYKMGNHEERYDRLMIRRCPEFLNIPSFIFENVLECEKFGIEVIKDQRIINFGKLPILHGHEVKIISVNVNPARSLFLKTYKSSCCAHLHRTSQHNEQALDGKIISCWSFGHLGDPHPKYARLNKWNHGLGRIEKNEDGDFEVINVNLMQNKLYRT